MPTAEDNFPKETARTIVSRFAPNELVFFDEMYEDLSSDPEAYDATLVLSRKLRMGGAAEITTLSALIIPVVVGVATHAINNTFDAIYGKIVALVGTRMSAEAKSTVDDNLLRDVADNILEAAKTSTSDNNAGKSIPDETGYLYSSVNGGENCTSDRSGRFQWKIQIYKHKARSLRTRVKLWCLSLPSLLLFFLVYSA
jgi:hypothetical protein